MKTTQTVEQPTGRHRMARKALHVPNMNMRTCMRSSDSTAPAVSPASFVSAMGPYSSLDDVINSVGAWNSSKLKQRKILGQTIQPWMIPAKSVAGCCLLRVQRGCCGRKGLELPESNTYVLRLANHGLMLRNRVREVRSDSVQRERTPFGSSSASSAKLKLRLLHEE